MADAPIVRLAGAEDVEALARLVAGFRDFLGADAPDADAIRRALGELLADPAHDLILGWTDGDPDPVGYAQLRVLPSLWATGREAYLEDLFVSERARGRGVGAALLGCAFDRARRRGATDIALGTNERNEPANAFYRAHGFAPAGETRWGGGREIRLTRRLVDGGARSPARPAPLR